MECVHTQWHTLAFNNTSASSAYYVHCHSQTSRWFGFLALVLGHHPFIDKQSSQAKRDSMVLTYALRCFFFMAIRPRLVSVVL